METNIYFLRPKAPGEFEIVRLDYKIMYPIETECIINTFSEFNAKQALYELTARRTRPLTLMTSEDGVTVTIGDHRHYLYHRVYSFYNKPKREKDVTQNNGDPLPDDSPKIKKQHILNIELEYKKEVLVDLNHFLSLNEFFLFVSLKCCFGFFHTKKKEIVVFVKLEMFDKAFIFFRFVTNKPDVREFTNLGIVQRNEASLQSPEQVSKFCKEKLKDMHSNAVIPLSPLVMNFVQIQQSDFNISLLLILSENYHTYLKNETKPNEYTKIGTHFSQMYNLCLDQPEVNTEEQANNFVVEESNFKVLKFKLYEDQVFKILNIEPSRYHSQLIEKFVEMLMNTKIKVYQNIGKKKVLKTIQVCFDHYPHKDDVRGTYHKVSINPYFFCQALPFNFYYKPHLHQAYQRACTAFNKGYEVHPMPSKLLLNFVLTLTKGEDFSIRNHDYPMARIKEKEHFSWLLIHCLETVMNSIFFEDVSLVDTSNLLFRETNIFQIQRLIVESKKKSTLAIRTVPKPVGFMPYITENFVTSLISKSLYQ